MLDFRGGNILEVQDPNSKIVLRINVKDFLPTRGAKFGSFDCKGLAGWPLHWYNGYSFPEIGVERLNNYELRII